MIEPKLLTLEQVAAALGCKLSKVEKMIAKREIESVKLGRLRRVPVTTVDDFVARLLEEARQERETAGSAA